MGSIKNVVSEPIEGHEDYHMMVSSRPGAHGAPARAPPAGGGASLRGRLSAERQQS